MKHESSLQCDELISLPKTLFTRFVGELDQEKLGAMDHSLAVALEIELGQPT